MRAGLGPSQRGSRVFLMRHADQRNGVLTAAGRETVRDVGLALAEWMDLNWRAEPEWVVLVATMQSRETRDTATLLVHTCEVGLARLRRGHPESNAPTVRFGQPQTFPRPSSSGRVDTRALSAYEPQPEVLGAVVHLLRGAECHPREARLFIGNDPVVSWVAGELTGISVLSRRIGRGRVPIARGELLCLAPGRWGWRVDWNLSADDGGQEDAVLGKIESKMKTAGALGTVIVGLTTFLAQNALRDEPTVWEWLSFAALLASSALYFSALFLYDTLQMPKRFWASGHPPRPVSNGQRLRRTRAVLRLVAAGRGLKRPPSSTARVLQTSMVQIWTWIFKPATVLAGVGVACLVGATAVNSGWRLDWSPWGFVAAIAGEACLLGLWVAVTRPSLGASD